MVRVFQQTPVSRAALQEWITSKQQAEHQRRQQQWQGAVPDEAIAFMSGVHQFSTAFKGGLGEGAVFVRALLSLPDSWVMFHDVFLQPQPQQFAQIDHVLIGPPGLFIVETKAWQGVFFGKRDQWQRKDAADRWVKCSSPTAQNLRHAQLFRQWLTPLLPSPASASLEQWVLPVVVMTRTRWLRTQDCSMPVCWGVSQLMEYLASHSQRCLTSAQVEQLAQLIASPPQPNATTATPTCRQCHSAGLSIQYGYSYYFKCQQCGANAVIRPPACRQCQNPQRLRKDRQRFFLDCPPCQSSHLFFTNPL